MNSDELKKKDILERIQKLEESILKANEYLETGANAHWHGFRPIFKTKIKNGKELPPHKDWIENVFLPNKVKALNEAEKVLERFE